MKWLIALLASLILCGGVFVLVSLTSPGHSKGSAMRTAALSNMKQLGLGMSLYLSEFDQRFPACDAWSDALLPHVKSKDLFWSRFYGEAQSPAMNALLDAKPLKLSTDSAKLTTLFQVPGPAWNAWGGPSGAWRGYDEERKVHVTFADSHAKSVPRANLVHLQWRP